MSYLDCIKRCSDQKVGFGQDIWILPDLDLGLATRKPVLELLALVSLNTRYRYRYPVLVLQRLALVLLNTGTGTPLFQAAFAA